MSDKVNHRIPHALLCSFEWKYNEHPLSLLLSSSQEVSPEEYDQSMIGKLYCPECKTPISRSPKKISITSNNRTAHFRHLPSYSHVDCSLRTSKPKGNNFVNEELVERAQEDAESVRIEGWEEEPPVKSELDGVGDFNQTYIEDSEGDLTEEAIGRHSGEDFSVPTRLRTVRALCNNFDANLNRGYILPNSTYSGLLKDLLFDVRRVNEETQPGEKLFFGRVNDFRPLDHRNVIELIIRREPKLVFWLYTHPENDERKNIDIGIRQRYILFHSDFHFKNSGVVECRLSKWGQYSILPNDYIDVLENKVIRF